MSWSQRRGFTLLEVMVAIAILAVSLVVLLQVQASSIEIAGKARNITIATELARGKLYDCQAELLKRGLNASSFSAAGNFSDEGHDEITWECQSNPIQIPLPSAEQVQQGIAAQQGGQGGMGGAAVGAMLAPFFSLIGTTLNQSVQELVVVVYWVANGESKESMRVVTHVVDPQPMKQLMMMLPAPPGGTSPSGTQPGSSSGPQSGQRQPQNPQNPAGPR